jgi:hypothetical protein
MMRMAPLLTLLTLVTCCGAAAAAEHVLPFRANALTDAEWAHVRRNYLTDHDASTMVTPNTPSAYVLENIETRLRLFEKVPLWR